MKAGDQLQEPIIPKKYIRHLNPPHTMTTTNLPTISDKQFPEQCAPFLHLSQRQLPSRTVLVYRKVWLVTRMV